MRHNKLHPVPGYFMTRKSQDKEHVIEIHTTTEAPWLYSRRLWLREASVGVCQSTETISNKFPSTFRHCQSQSPSFSGIATSHRFQQFVKYNLPTNPSLGSGTGAWSQVPFAVNLAFLEFESQEGWIQHPIPRALRKHHRPSPNHFFLSIN